LEVFGLPFVLVWCSIDRLAGLVEQRFISRVKTIERKLVPGIHLFASTPCSDLAKVHLLCLSCLQNFAPFVITCPNLADELFSFKKMQCSSGAACADLPHELSNQ
jgi:hypothetical protein